MDNPSKKQESRKPWTTHQKNKRVENLGQQNTIEFHLVDNYLIPHEILQQPSSFRHRKNYTIIKAQKNISKDKRKRNKEIKRGGETRNTAILKKKR